jgi:OmpA-OmpF porin, OOP family
MKNPIPLLSVALAFVIFGSTYIRSLICPCNVAAVLTTSTVLMPTIVESQKSIVLKEVILNFSYADSKIKTKQEIAELKEFLNAHENSTVLISGHTDNLGSEAYNQNLSESRAETVMSILVRNGVKATKITTQGKGESAPLTSNDTKKGRQQNRRVVVQIYG